MVGRLVKHRRTERCFDNMEIRLRWEYVEVESWCAEMEFTLNRKKG